MTLSDGEVIVLLNEQKERASFSAHVARQEAAWDAFQHMPLKPAGVFTPVEPGPIKKEPNDS